MPTIAAIKAAARKLPVKHRTDLLEDLVKDQAVRKEQIARLRAMVEEGVRDHDAGRYIAIRTAAEHSGFFAAIKRRGRVRLGKSA